MYDKKQTKSVRLWEFPRSRFIEYEKSDLSWAKFGYAKLLVERTDVIHNEEVTDQELVKHNSSDGGQIIADIQVLNTSIVHNPFSNWKPKWNPELVG